MEDDFSLFGEMTDDEKLQIKHKREAWLAKSIDAKSLNGRRKQFFRKYIHQSPIFEEVIYKLHNIFSAQECQAILDAHLSGAWESNRHSAFPTTDQSLFADIHVKNRITNRAIPHIATRYGFQENDLDLLDLFLVKYSANEQSSLKTHTDGCILSFNILLNDSMEFVGGGTIFPDFDEIISCKRGDCVVHPGKILHGGSPITKGKRFLLVGFLETKRIGKLSKMNMVRKLKF